MKIQNNPIDIVIKIFEENYPKAAKKVKQISFAKIDKGYACTDFTDNGIYIYISPVIKRRKPITVEVAAELLAHELAHAVCGEAEEHGEKWELTYGRINELYCEEAIRIRDLEEELR